MAAAAAHHHLGSPNPGAGGDSSVYDKLRMFNGQAAAAASWAWYSGAAGAGQAGQHGHMAEVAAAAAAMNNNNNTTSATHLPSGLFTNNFKKDLNLMFSISASPGLSSPTPSSGGGGHQPVIQGFRDHLEDKKPIIGKIVTKGVRKSTN